MGYSATTWAEVKADYETGDYSLDKLTQKYPISRDAIKNKSVKDKWIKGKSKPLIEQGIAERNIAMFAKLGMTQEKVAQKLMEGVNDDDKSISFKYLQELNKMFGTHAPLKKDITSDGEKIAPNIHMYLPDNGRNNT